MKEYIEKDLVMNALFHEQYGYCCEDAINDIPAADVVEVRHGRWVLTTQPLGWRDEDCVECSECGEDFVLDEWGIEDVKDAMRYCPSCGAKMDGGEDDAAD